MGAEVERLRAHAPEVIAVGGSAGAWEVLVDVLATLPPTLPAAVVVVVHLPADTDHRFVESLGAGCALPVVEAEDKMPVAPATVYVAPADYHLLFERDGTLALSADAPVHFSRPSIDVLFDSVAEAFGTRGCGILLSGASADGAAGLAAISRRGGLTWVQSPETARVPLMPQQALALVPHPRIAVADMARMFVEWGNARG